MADKNKIVQFVTDKTLKVDNAWIRGLIQGIPQVGGTLDTWLFQFADAAKAKRVEDALNDLKARVSVLEANAEYVEIHVEEFAYLTERVVVYVAQDYREDMRTAYVNMLAHFYSDGFSKLENKELYLQYLSTMTPLHLVVLTQFNESLGDKNSIKIQPGEDKEDVIANLVKQGVDKTLADSLVNDLVTRGMVSHVQSSAVGGDVHVYSVTSLGKTMLELVKV